MKINGRNFTDRNTVLLLLFPQVLSIPAEIMSNLCLLLVTASCLLHLGQQAFVLTVIPTNIKIGIPQKVTLACRFDGDNSTTNLTRVTWVGILKERSPEKFDIMAGVRSIDHTVHNMRFGPTANVTGIIKDLHSSYLSVTWSIPESNILGSYRCDSLGFNASRGIITEETSLLVLTEGNVTAQDVHDLTDLHVADLEEELEAQKMFCRSRIGVVELRMDTRLSVLKKKQENASRTFVDGLLTQLNGLTEDVKSLMEAGALQYWPGGTYALPMPDSNCPNNMGAQWTTGYRKFHTESTDQNHDQISPSSHLKMPALERVGTNNFVYQYFCVSSSPSSGADWPKGSYCINRVGSACPGGFISGSITWQDEVTHSAANISGAFPDGIYSANTTTIIYCCRDDGEPSDPIYLPRARPFYLYRYNGTCQEVVGMQTSDEYITFDTDNSNQDEYDNSFHPDGTINNVRIELCYYSEKQP